MSLSKANGLSLALCVAIGLAATSSVNATDTATGPEVTPAVQHDTLHSLRGVMPRPDDFVKNSHAHPAHPLPFLDGPGNQTDGAVQGSGTGSFAPSLGAGFDGVGQGFSGPQGTFTVNSARRIPMVPSVRPSICRSSTPGSRYSTSRPKP
jgi:hypothetical protein